MYLLRPFSKCKLSLSCLSEVHDIQSFRFPAFIPVVLLHLCVKFSSFLTITLMFALHCRLISPVKETSVSEIICGFNFQNLAIVKCKLSIHQVNLILFQDLMPGITLRHYLKVSTLKVSRLHCLYNGREEACHLVQFQ